MMFSFISFIIFLEDPFSPMIIDQLCPTKCVDMNHKYHYIIHLTKLYLKNSTTSRDDLISVEWTNIMIANGNV